MCVNAYTDVATKTISITDEAYKALLREKKRGESFTETILRITAKSGKLADCYGAWKMTDEEEASVRNELAEGWRETRARLDREMPRH
jgi:predicted CopG family antitoxin